jgi:putative hemolysin
MGKDEMTASHGSGGRMSQVIVVFSLSWGLAFASPPAWALPNPASVFCAKSGGKSEMRKGPRGVYGVCRFPDGRVVDEWTYFDEMKGKSGAR